MEAVTVIGFRDEQKERRKCKLHKKKSIVTSLTSRLSIHASYAIWKLIDTYIDGLSRCGKITHGLLFISSQLNGMGSNIFRLSYSAIVEINSVFFCVV